VSFTLSDVNGNIMKSRGNRLTDEMKNMIREAPAGERFFFENIKAVATDEKIRQINPVTVQLK
jgi:hypothetical protein